jgi:hypothetical protein
MDWSRFTLTFLSSNMACNLDVLQENALPHDCFIDWIVYETMQRKETSMEMNYHLIHHATGNVYAARLDYQATCPEGRHGYTVLEVYGPLSATLLSERHLALWDYSPALRIEDIAWVQEALLQDLFLFFSLDYAQTHCWGSFFEEGWHAGVQFGQAHPDATDFQVQDEVLWRACQATASLEDDVWERPWIDYRQGFFNGCMAAIGRFIEEHGA